MKIIHINPPNYLPIFSYKNRGFTLLEVIVAIFILTVGAGAAFALIQQTLISTSLVEDRFIASYLIQEGIEIVKNLRDKAWLENNDWDVYLQQEGNWQADYSSQSLTSYNPNEVLRIDSDGFYSYSDGTSTKFQRKITISDKEANKMKVSVQVSWKERGRTHSLEALEYITNWQK